MVHFKERDLRIEKIEKAKIYLSRNDLDAYTGKAFFLKVQKFGRAGRDIDDTAFAERAAIGDTDDHPFHIGQIGDTQKSAERMFPVSRHQFVSVMDPSAGCLTPVETVMIIRSKPLLLPPCGIGGCESDQQKDDMYQTKGHTCYRFYSTIT